MLEIVVSKRRKGTRYGWKCPYCGAAAGAWPEEKTAIASAERHEKSPPFNCKEAQEKLKAIT